MKNEVSSTSLRAAALVPAEFSGSAVPAPAPDAGPESRPPLQVSALQAVETVWGLVERAANERNAVRLEFDVAGESLSVVVERSADDVRATFSTDSAELRRIVSQEWQVVAAEQPARVIETVFIESSSGCGSGTDPRDSSAEGRERGREEQQGFARHAPRENDEAGRARVPIAPRAPRPHATSRHLYALA